MVEVDLGTLAQGPRRGLEALQTHQPAAGGEKGVGTAEGVAAMDVRHFQALHVDGAALAGADHLHAAAVALQAAGAGGQGAGHEAEFVPFADRAGNDRARDDRAVPLEGEHAVHRQAEDVGAVPGRQAAGAGQDMFAQGRDALARAGRDGEDGGAFQKSALQEGAHVFLDQFQPVRVHHVHLGQGHETVPDAQQGADLQMFAGLGHDAFVGGDDQHDEVHTGGTGHHVFDEAFMAGHVHDAQTLATRHGDPGEAQFDGDAAPLLFFQTVTVDARQRADQRCLAVVDVTGGTQDQSHSTPRKNTGAPPETPCGGPVRGTVPCTELVFSVRQRAGLCKRLRRTTGEVSGLQHSGEKYHN